VHFFLFIFFFRASFDENSKIPKIIFNDQKEGECENKKRTENISPGTYIESGKSLIEELTIVVTWKYWFLYEN
jgi:hypothetical protein